MKKPDPLRLPGDEESAGGAFPVSVLVHVYNKAQWRKLDYYPLGRRDPGLAIIGRTHCREEREQSAREKAAHPGSTTGSTRARSRT